MPYNKTMKVRITNDQYEKVKQLAYERGYQEISSYVRNLISSNDDPVRYNGEGVPCRLALMDNKLRLIVDLE